MSLRRKIQLKVKKAHMSDHKIFTRFKFSWTTFQQKYTFYRFWNIWNAILLRTHKIELFDTKFKDFNMKSVHASYFLVKCLRCLLERNWRLWNGPNIKRIKNLFPLHTKSMSSLETCQISSITTKYHYFEFEFERI